MSNTLFESLLKDLNKANKARKVKLTQKAGFQTVEDYRDHLKDLITGGTGLQPNLQAQPDTVAAPQTPTVKPTIHVVDIIDCSASMSGAKIQNAVRGINSGIEKLKSENDVNYTYTICDFSYHNDINYKHVLTEISKVQSVSFRDRGNTALRDAIGETLDLIREKVKDNTEKVLVNIYTDGEENGSQIYSDGQIAALIETLQKENFTITFIGTNNDVNRVVKAYKLHESNTLKYDGSAKGLEVTLDSTSIARSSFKSKVLRGEDVTMGFYKDIN
jgi:uncharacterized protein YegL